MELHFEEFELLERIGKGAFGYVYLAKHMSGKIFVLKVYREKN